MGPGALSPEDAAGGEPEAWYGSIQYLVNISAVGAASCVLLFLLVKLRFDHRRIPGPSALAAKLLAVYHATAPQIALHCGADAAQFLLFERASFLVLAAVSAAAFAAALPLNLLAGDAAIADQFAATTISHIPRASRCSGSTSSSPPPSSPSRTSASPGWRTPSASPASATATATPATPTPAPSPSSPS
ncbi:hypothetical protein ZWY2020_037707 [Hordeum vulgare]|nr:hypothetical protein ZWY2020_037707 [Hordeum vulgare]